MSDVAVGNRVNCHRLIIRITILALLLMFRLNVAHALEAGDTSVSIVFLTEDAANGFDHSGCSADVIDSLKAYVADEHPDNYVHYDLGKLLDAGIGPFYIYNKRYCKPIGDLLDANTFVMTRVEISKGHEVCDDVYDVEVKVYSSLSGAEEVIFTAKSGKKQGIQQAIAESNAELFQQILRVAKRVNIQ